MVSLEKLARPDLVEGRFSNFQENVIPGWIPAEITSIDDPKKLGRVKVRSDLIAENVDLPNDDDGWVWTGENYTVNAATGGSHRLLTVGSQVAVMGMLGDPRKLILIACIPNFVDPPSPELDRSQGLYGEQTPGGVYKIRQDNDASAIDAYPHGIVHHISGAGDVSTQTKEGAMVKLQSNGTVINQNKTASGVLSPDGTIQWRNAAKGSSILDKDGNWNIQSQNQSALKLGASDALIEGPRTDLATMVNSIGQNLTGKLGKAENLLSQVNGILGTFQNNGNANQLLQNLSQVVGEVDGIIKSFPESISAINQIKSQFSATDLGESLMQQAETFLKSGLGKLTPEFRKIIQQGLPADEIIAKVTNLLPNDLKSKINTPEIKSILQGLSHHPEMQEQSLLEAIAPEGFASIQNIVGMDLHGTLAQTQNLFEQATIPNWVNVNRLSPENLLGFMEGDTSLFKSDDDILGNLQIKNWQGELQEQASKLTSFLPDDLQKLFQKQDIAELLQLALTGGNPVQALLGKAALSFADDLLPELLGGVGLGGAIAPLQKLIGIAGTGDIGDALSLVKEIPGLSGLDLGGISNVVDVIPQAVSSVFGGLGGLFGKGKKKTNRLLNALNQDAKGGVLRVTNNLVEAAASKNALSAKMVITGSKAALTAVNGLSEVYASGAKASLSSLGGSEIFAHGGNVGFSSPHGKLNIGSGGGGWFSKGMMAMRIAQDIGKSAGMVLHPKSGVSLASFEDSSFDIDEADNWGNKTAEITVDEGSVIIRSHLGGKHSIDITPHGIYIEGYRISEYLINFHNRFSAIEEQLTGLQLP
ncbi:hypothetical protein FD723_40815 (plasmid) [Nostoc sp. C052]|uniref:hypothetical protein n=1 Tax=Nostoc sp. C052 TaxID=2576902 RepID=UPI0015C38F69|nr:hypothetical protein [Nostoc sp. C052]QLE46558.1 hypothetical protein FD723_40815 [Nostoc sp. C052]